MHDDERVARVRVQLAACDHALARYRALVTPPDRRLVADVERMRDRVAAELRELEADSRSGS